MPYSEKVKVTVREPGKRVSKPAERLEQGAPRVNRKRRAAQQARAAQKQREVARAALAAKFPECRVLPRTSLPADGDEAVVWLSNERLPGSNEDYMVMVDFLRGLFPEPEDEDLWVKKTRKGRVFHTSHLHKHRDALKQCPTLMHSLKAFLAPLIEVGYSPVEVEAVARAGDLNPMHQDRKTGAHAFSRREHKGLRVLVSICGWTESSVEEIANRVFRFEVKNPDGSMEEVLRTTAPVVVMNCFAAGHNCEGNVFHGRPDPGITLSIDLALPIVQGSKLGVTPLTSNREIYNFFHYPTGSISGNKLHLATGGTTGPKPGARWAAACSRAKAAATAGLATPHCWNCSSPKAYKGQRGWVIRDDRYFCRVCAKEYTNLEPAERAAASSGACDGVTCSGCKVPEGAGPGTFPGKRQRKRRLTQPKGVGHSSKKSKA